MGNYWYSNNNVVDNSTTISPDEKKDEVLDPFPNPNGCDTCKEPIVFRARLDKHEMDFIQHDFSRLSSARDLLDRRLKNIKKEREEKWGVNSAAVRNKVEDILVTHTIPIDFTFKPSVQMIESVVTTKWHEAKELSTILIPLKELSYQICLFWDLRLEIDGEYKDTEITKFELEINGAIIDSYKRKRYASSSITPLEFYPKNKNTPLADNATNTINILVHDVPAGVKLRVIARKVIMDKILYDILDSKCCLYPMIEHHEYNITSNRMGFQDGGKTCLVEYGVTTDEGDLKDYLESVDGLSFNVLSNMYEIKNNVLWIKMLVPLPQKMLEFEIVGKKLKFIAKIQNWILASDRAICKRYSTAPKLIDLNEQDK